MTFIPAFKIGVWNVWMFMSVFLFQMLAIWFLDKRAWERSHVPAEVKKNKLERYTGGVANVIWLLAMGYSLFLPLKTGTFWFYMGLCVFIIGLTILISATINFITASPDQPITRGAYRLSRHPMYVAIFFICLGSGFASGSGLFVFLTISMALCFNREAMIEERYCLTSYGNKYKEYMKKTPRWIGVPKKDKKKKDE